MKLQRKIIFILAIITMIVGAGVISYPFVSNWFYERNATTAVTEYNYTVAQMTEDELGEQRKIAEHYNEMLNGTGITDPFQENSGYTALEQDYLEALSTTSIMAYVEIPKIDVLLPIYHGTSSSVLDKGVGHLEASALPIGGVGNHAVLTGHTGLTKAKLFTDLVKLELGDIFYIDVLSEKLAYEIISIDVILPEDTALLQPESGQDLVTLVTCTPYGINSHRLLVRGQRTDYIVKEATQAQNDYLSWMVLLIILLVVGYVIKRCVSQMLRKNTNER